MAQSLLGLVPVGRVADVFAAVGVAQADAHAVIVHAQRSEDRLDEFEASDDFGADLFRGAEKVSIILSEGANPGHAAEFSRLLPAIHRAEFREAHRQVAVAFRALGENPDVMRTIHRLEQVAVELPALEPGGQIRAGTLFIRKFLKLIALRYGRKLAFLVVGEMPAGAIQIELADVRSKDL